MTIPGSVRIIRRSGKEPVVAIRESGERTVVHVFWPGRENHDVALTEALRLEELRESCGVEAPCA